MTYRPLLVVLISAALLAACGSGESGENATTTTVTLPVGSLPSPVTTAVPTSVTATTTVRTTVPATVPVTVRPTTTVATSTTSPTSTTVASKVPCTLDRIIADTQTTYPGITATGLRCADVWASWIGTPDSADADGFFAVASWDGSVWELRNLGTAGICEDGGVPTQLWDSLGCSD
jgi:hypothetical protein